MAQDIEKALKTIGDLVRAARASQTRKQIRQLAGKRLNREQRLELAYRARQAELPEVTLRLLAGVGAAGAKGRANRQPSEPERIEYAIALSELNAAREARKVLAEVDIRKFPRAIRPMALACFREWDWVTPLPQLDWLIRHPRASLGDRLSARILLGAGFLHGKGDSERAREILEGVIRDTRADYFPHPYQNALQLLAQVHFYQRDYGQAMRALERAEKIPFKSGESNLGLVIEQWRAIVSYEMSAHQAGPLARLRAVRAIFASQDRYENVRSCSYYEALLTRDEGLLVMNYYGNPFPTYREKILRAFGADLSAIPPFHVRRVGGRAEEPRALLELLNGRNTSGGARLKPGQIQQRLLWALAADFFLPPRAALLHERLYPDELYRPGPSLVRVSQGMKRLRRWLAAARVPLHVAERGGRYFLESRAGIRLRIDRELLGEHAPPSEVRPAPGVTPTSDLRLHAALQELKNRFAAADFGAADAAELWRCSGWNALDRLKDGIAARRIEKLSAGPRTRYRLI